MEAIRIKKGTWITAPGQPASSYRAFGLVLRIYLRGKKYSVEVHQMGTSKVVSQEVFFTSSFEEAQEKAEKMYWRALSLYLQEQLFHDEEEYPIPGYFAEGVGLLILPSEGEIKAQPTEGSLEGSGFVVNDTIVFDDCSGVFESSVSMDPLRLATGGAVRYLRNSSVVGIAKVVSQTRIRVWSKPYVTDSKAQWHRYVVGALSEFAGQEKEKV